MQRLEIVHLRATGSDVPGLARQIDSSIEAEGHGRRLVTVYRRHGLGTDVAIHIQTGAETGETGPSVLGLRLADALREHGLVEHTVWEELR